MNIEAYKERILEGNKENELALNGAIKELEESKQILEMEIAENLELGLLDSEADEYRKIVKENEERVNEIRNLIIENIKIVQDEEKLTAYLEDLFSIKN